MLNLLVSAAALLLTTTYGQSVTDKTVTTCGVIFNTYSTTYDIEPLQKIVNTRNNGIITMTGGDLDCTAHTVEENYTYYAGVCQQMDKQHLPDNCQNIGDAWAAQSAPPTCTLGVNCPCHNAGTVASGATMDWSLWDASNPASGVVLSYKGGETCNTYKHDRELRLVFKCENTLEVTPSKATEPLGSKSCIYEVEIPTVYGCPTECKRVNDKVCSDKGICGYDRTNKKSKCFCDDGFAGEACEVTVSGGPSTGAVVGLLVVVFFICLALLGGLYYVMKQLKSYKTDTDNYMRLNAGGDSLDPEI